MKHNFAESVNRKHKVAATSVRGSPKRGLLDPQVSLLDHADLRQLVKFSFIRAGSIHLWTIKQSTPDARAAAIRKTLIEIKEKGLEA
jgi:hypothetical protein